MQQLGKVGQAGRQSDRSNLKSEILNPKSNIPNPMSTRLEELTLTFTRERIRWGTTAVLDCELLAGVDGPQCTPSSPALRFSKAITVKTDCEPDELIPHLSYRFYGHWTAYQNRRTGIEERQFAAKTFVRCQPHGQAGVVRYLMQAPHVGHATAKRLWERFQGDAVRILRESPDVAVAAVAAAHFDQAKAEAAAAYLDMERKLEDCTLDLMDLLDGRGFRKNLPKQVVKAWGNRAAEVIRRDPYKLRHFAGSGFTRCDKLFMDLGGNPGRLKRQALAGAYLLEKLTSREGHTWHSRDVFVGGITGLIGGAKVRPARAAMLAKRAGLLAARRDESGKLWLAVGKKAADEQSVAERVLAAIHETDPQYVGKFEEVTTTEVRRQDHTRCVRCKRKLTAAVVAVWNGLPYGPECIKRAGGDAEAERVSLEAWLDGKAETVTTSQTVETGFDRLDFSNHWPDLSAAPGPTEHQRQTVELATVGRIGLLGGSPGTGKTFVVGCLAREIVDAYGPDQIAFAAPTGKAAVRMTESLLAQGVRLRARTIHSLLGVAQLDSETGWGFSHGAENPLPYKFLVVDEGSMEDTTLMARFLEARDRGTHLLIVGDINQLPPVGHGAPLRDLIAAGIPYGELREIQRQKAGSSICQACADIRDGRPFRTDAVIDPANGKNLKLIETRGNTQTLQEVLKLLRNIRLRGLADPVWDCQVIVAVNGNSELSRKAINKELQGELNPGGKTTGGSPFREGDKVVCLKNGFVPVAENSPAEANQEGLNAEGTAVYVANGEFGRVLQVEEKLTYVRLDAPHRVVKIPRGKVEASGEDYGEEGGASEEAAATGCSWDLAYGCTCHKMQGSEVPIAIVLGDQTQGARNICDRSWIYTAISRAKQICIMIGQEELFHSMRRRSNIDKRKTFLKEMILKGRTERTVGV